MHVIHCIIEYFLRYVDAHDDPPQLKTNSFYDIYFALNVLNGAWSKDDGLNTDRIIT